MLSNEFVHEYYNNNKSGKMSLEKFVSNNYPKDYEKILLFTSLLSIPFKEKVYHTINNISDNITCKNPSCDKLVKFRNSTLGYFDYCSNKCVGTDPDIIIKKENTNIEKFGVKHAFLNDDIKEKVIKIYENRTEEYMDTIKKKRKKTVSNKYGVDNVAKIKEVQSKRVDTFKENIDEWKKNYKSTSLERYGVEHPWMLNDVHKKTVDASIENRITEAKNKVLQKLPPNYILVDVHSIGANRLISTINCPQGHDFEIGNSLLYDRTIRNKTEICTICNPNGKNFSGKEIELLNFMTENYTKEIITNSRNIISPYEIDIYIPEFNIAFEFNGLYWHSELYKENDYHQMKTELCEEKGIQLIHIWEDDWVYKNDIIKSMIINKLNQAKKIYARKCEIKEITDTKLIREFLNNNHLQGFVGSKIKLGLFYNNELVSLMTFGGMRKLMGHEDENGVYELMRFCNIKDHTVIGGASKLFKYFTTNFDYKKIYSYSDNSHSNGNLYKALKFELDNTINKLNYYWVVDDKRHHRYNFRKDILVKMGYDINKSEREIMYEDVGSFRVWGCGNKRWSYKKRSLFTDVAYP